MSTKLDILNDRIRDLERRMTTQEKLFGKLIEEIKVNHKGFKLR